MTAVEARTRAKVLLDIPSADSTWDSTLEGFANNVVKDLSPILLQELSVDTSVTLTANSNTFALPAGMVELRWMEVESYEGSGVYHREDGFMQQDNDIYLDTTFSDARAIRLFGLGEYAIGDIPGWCETVIEYWVIAKFYFLLAGNRRKYNQYMQSSGARGVENMREMGKDYQADGNQHLMDRVKVRGL